MPKCCTIWYHLYNLKNVKNAGGVLLVVEFRAEACNFTNGKTPPWAFFMFFKLYKWYQIAQSITHMCQVTASLKKYHQKIPHHRFFFLEFCGFFQNTSFRNNSGWLLPEGSIYIDNHHGPILTGDSRFINNNKVLILPQLRAVFLNVLFESIFESIKVFIRGFIVKIRGNHFLLKEYNSSQ